MGFFLMGYFVYVSKLLKSEVVIHGWGNELSFSTLYTEYIMHNLTTEMPALALGYYWQNVTRRFKFDATSRP